MRKSLFLTLVLSLCVADFGAFAATARSNARGTNNVAASSGAAPVAARAATVRGVAAPKTAAPVAARAAVRQNTTSSSTGNVAARAATKKALAMGTKVAAATENTAISTDCQNFYYGCMDAFCMLDNAAGGRCQCSDKGIELDAVLDEIMKLDEQSARIASEGVETVQMGEYAGQINARAKAVENNIGGKSSVDVARGSSSSMGILDLSAFSNDALFDDGTLEEETESVFASSSITNDVMDDIARRKGDDLQKAAARACIAQIPAQCKSSSALLQMSYVQKVRSDCVGYENALKQQKSASQQKLLAAQKAVRDAVLTEVREQNKYETAGECAVALAQCMQTTGGCGDDYTGCVTLAAAENVKSTKRGSIAKQTTIKGIVSGADITLAASTMESLLAKKEICASVTRQCVNANKNDAVWNVFLRNAAPALKSAELIAEQDLRSNCIPNAAKCFTDACKSQFGTNDESYDMCLSNPKTYMSFCKVQLEPCLEATGGSYTEPEKSTLWNGLVAMLNSMKVDACTKEVKDCLLSEDRCGPDYAGCIGLDSQSIAELCPVDKLTACMTDYNPNTVREYVVQVAQGLALNIDNSFLTQCQNAANEAMIKVCGDTESCDNLSLDLSSLASLMKVQACTLQKDKDGKYSSYCLPDISQFSDDEMYSFDYAAKTVEDDLGNKKLVYADSKLLRQSNIGDDKSGYKTGYGVYATLLDKPDVSHIIFDDETKKFSSNGVVATLANPKATQLVDYFSQASTDAVVSILDGALNRYIGQIEADPKVIYCQSGREVEGFDGTKFGKKAKDGEDVQGRFPNLTDEYKYTIANGLLAKLSEKNMEVVESFDEQIIEMNTKIAERVAEIAKKRGESVEQAVDDANLQTCMGMGNKIEDADFLKLKNGSGWCAKYLSFSKQEVYKVSSYNPETNVCVVEKRLYDCQDWDGSFLCRKRCRQFDNGTVVSTENIQMSSFK